MIYLIVTIILYTFFFIGYLEWSPHLGNIWYRTNADGIRVLQWGGLLEMIVAPFRISELWQVEYWDINYPMGIIIIVSVYIFYDLMVRFFGVMPTIYE